MIELVCRILLLVTLLMIFFQDNKERQVYWFMFPITAILFSILHYTSAGGINFLINSAFNLILIFCVLCCLLLYTYLVLKIEFFKAFGLGDLLFFLAISFSFSTITFVVCFIISIFFCLLIHFIFNTTNKFETVPLAGNMSLFFLGILVLDWLDIYKNSYFL